MDYLFRELAERKKRNPQYSLRAFAKSLKVSPTHLSLILNGKKKPSAQMLSKFISLLELTPDAAKKFILSGVPNYSEELSAEQARVLNEEEFSHIAEWHHYAILSYAALRSNEADPGKIAKRLGIDLVMVKESMRRLQRLGLIEVKNGRLRQTSKPLMTTTDVPSTYIRNFHKQILQLAIQKISDIPVAKREYSSSTLAIDSAKLPRAKKMIADFRRKLIAELKSESPTQVYVLSMQMFPVTTKGEE